MQLCREQAAPEPGNREFAVPVQVCTGAAALRLAQPPRSEPCQQRGSGEGASLGHGEALATALWWLRRASAMAGRESGVGVRGGCMGGFAAHPLAFVLARGEHVMGGKRLELHPQA